MQGFYCKDRGLNVNCVVPLQNPSPLVTVGIFVDRWRTSFLKIADIVITRFDGIFNKIHFCIIMFLGLFVFLF